MLGFRAAQRTRLCISVFRRCLATRITLDTQTYILVLLFAHVPKAKDFLVSVARSLEVPESQISKVVKEWNEELFSFGAPMTTVGFLKVLTSNAITWKNIDLPPHVKDKIVKELVPFDVKAVKIVSEEDEKEKDSNELTITLMTGPQCTLCTVAKAVIAGAAAKVNNAIVVKEVNIHEHKKYFDMYKHDIPVGLVGDKELFRHRLTEQFLLDYYEDRKQQKSGSQE